jgi:hypothetical protein
MAQSTWQCRLCGAQYKWSTIPSPKAGGSNNGCPKNPPSKNHVWEKIG